ncbi:hypothetical protein [Gemmatimonas sp.]|uniref:hypothetical protein n=1 Tax=Gemmatimonas sp. TaxID=1962908 RepID=UPI0037BFC6A5
MSMGLVLVVIMGGTGMASAQSIPAPGPCDSGVGSSVSCRIHVNVTTTIQATHLLTVQPGTQFSLTPVGGGLTAADLTAGFYDSPGSLTVSVSANAPWRLSLRAASASLSGACATKASSSITWGISSGARTTPLSTTATDVVSGAAGTVNLTRSIFLRVGLSWLVDGPVTESNCGLPVAFTVSAP